MRILNVGSINIDHVYRVDHFVRPGETLASTRYTLFAGGKGYNQSVALARAGARVRHAGCIGNDGRWLLERLEGEGIDTAAVGVCEGPTGHALIQVTPEGENAIILHGGSNHKLDTGMVSRAVRDCQAGDFLLLQNETSALAEALALGRERGLTVVFNPAPMGPEVAGYPLDCVDLFILNETEAEGLTGEHEAEAVRRILEERFPGAAVVLTLGSRGACYFDRQRFLMEPATPVEAVDTTAAGDTFIGYFLAELMRTGKPASALQLGCRAAALCVTRPGASDSVPWRHELADAGNPD